MRTIKFRAWDVHNKKIIFPAHFSTNEHGGLNFSSMELMQYTGLHDKNGKEIYEGDIFTFTKGRRKTVAKVVFEEAMFKMKDNNGWGVMILQREDDMEVIGNIYENPELLK